MTIKQIRSTKEYRKSLEDVRERDRGICQLSGASREDMEIHHIIPLNRLILDWKKEKFYKELYYKKIFDIDNLITITKSLHLGFHSKYGKRHSIKEWEDFSNSIEYVANRDITITEEEWDIEGGLPMIITIVGEK